ncbi:MAG: acyl carrier protein [Crocinitomicaceae bacterium]|nr:acyl carrier protein [Crocinitomicaceae bacterium]|tara:strand:+ start:1351 stop:1605 length:255 start_codon:yes stop_codon:yes gene_type:complete
MDSAGIEEKLKDIIKPYIGDEEAFNNLTPSTNLLSDLKINSAHLVDVILDAEEAFDIEIDDDNAEKMLTVQASVDIITQKLKEK